MARMRKSFDGASDKFFSTVDPVEEQSSSTVKKIAAEGALKRKTYYVTEEQHKALRLMSVDKDVDISFLVRQALDAFLKNDHNEY